MDRIIGNTILATFAVAVIFVAYLFLVLLPVSMWAENKCLAKGYPKTNVTITLDVYCMNMDGAVTVRVEKLP